jgi:hypothetical protein
VHESRALAVLQRTLEVLRGLGISEQLVEWGNDAVQLQMRFSERFVRSRFFDIRLEVVAPLSKWAPKVDHTRTHTRRCRVVAEAGHVTAGSLIEETPLLAVCPQTL